MQQQMPCPSTEEYTEFARRHEPSLRYALVAQLGYQAGREATQDALVYAWEHWGRIRSVTNPGGYLFRVAKRRALRQRATRGTLVMDLPENPSPQIEPSLNDALRHLSKRQRAVVFLVEGLGLSYQETPEPRAAIHGGFSRPCCHPGTVLEASTANSPIITSQRKTTAAP